MPITQNLIMEEELEPILANVLFLRKQAKSLLDKLSLTKILRKYKKLRVKISNLNYLADKYNIGDNFLGMQFDAEGKAYTLINNEKRRIFEEAVQICEDARRKIFHRKMEVKYGRLFEETLKEYEEIIAPFHRYLEQEGADRSTVPSSGMDQVRKVKQERGF